MKSDKNNIFKQRIKKFIWLYKNSTWPIGYRKPIYGIPNDKIPYDKIPRDKKRRDREANYKTGDTGGNKWVDRFCRTHAKAFVRNYTN